MLSVQEYELLSIYQSDSFQKTKDNLYYAYQYYSNSDKGRMIKELHQKISDMAVEEYEFVIKMLELT